MAVGMSEIQAFLAGEILMATLTTLIPLLRLYVLRHTIRDKHAWVSEICFGTACMLGAGLRWYDVKKADDELELRQHQPEASDLALLLQYITEPWLKYEFAESITHLIELWLVKGAFLAFYCRLVGPRVDSNLLLWSIRITAISLPVTFVGNLIAFVLECNPISLNWSVQAILGGKFCGPYWHARSQIISLVLTLVTDFMILGIPLLLLRSLQLSRLERRILPLIFLMGIISVSAPLIRFFVLQAQGAYVETGFKYIDFKQWHLVKALSDLETLAAIAAFSMPAFRVFLTGTCCGGMRTKLLTPYFSSYATGSRGIRNSQIRASGFQGPYSYNSDNEDGEVREGRYEREAAIEAQHGVELDHYSTSRQRDHSK